MSGMAGMADYLFPRDGIWHFRRRVPTEFAHLDPRGIVRASTNIRVDRDRSGAKATRVADKLNADLESFWMALRDGDRAAAQLRYDAARRSARSLGFSYTPVVELAQRPTGEILERIEKLVSSGRTEDPAAIAGALGTAEEPKVMLSQTFDVYEKLVVSEMRDFSPNQLRRWRNAKKLALASLQEVIGDKPLTDITRNDALDFREWWLERVMEEDLDPDTANKSFGHISRMFNEIEMRHRLKIGHVFSDLRLRGAQDNQRAAYEIDYVQRVLLRAGALDELNEEARGVIYLVADTGLRLSEAANLNESTIVLDADIPHVQVRPDGRRMKTSYSKREIPLVGSALAAMKRFPHGFPRYYDKAASLSALINKFLDDHRMRPTEEHTAYSLRHTFEDRLTRIEAPEKVTATLMGHKYDRPKYGEGPPLDQKLRWLEKIAFAAPAGF